MGIFSKTKQRKKDLEGQVRKDDEIIAARLHVEELQQTEGTLRLDLNSTRTKLAAEKRKSDSLTMELALRDSRIEFLQQQLVKRLRTDSQGITQFLQEPEMAATRMKELEEEVKRAQTRIQELEKEVEQATRERETAVEDSLQRLRRLEQMQTQARQKTMQLVEIIPQEFEVKLRERTNLLQRESASREKNLRERLEQEIRSKEEEHRAALVEQSGHMKDLETRISRLLRQVNEQETSLLTLRRLLKSSLRSLG